MKRPFLVAAAVAAALMLFALPAAAGNDHNVDGTVTSVTSTTISVQGRSGVVTTCSLGRHSPSVAGVSPGDHVRMLCAGFGRRMARLARLRRLDPATAPATVSADTTPVTFGGAITALSDTSISLHDGDRDLTCSLGDGSPSTSGFKVGQHVKVACAGGALVSISALGSGDVGRWFTGTISSLDGQDITVSTEHNGQVTCSLGDGSPSTDGFGVGDHVGIGCRASTMQLVLIRKLGDGSTSTSGSGSGSTSGGDGSTSSGDGSTSGGGDSGSTGDGTGSGSSDSGSTGDGSGSDGGDTSTTPSGGGN